MLSKRLMNITPSYTITTNQKVSVLKDHGVHVINFSTGEPDFNIPKNAKEIGKKSLDDNKTSYDKVPGLIELRQAISNKLCTENNLIYSVDEIVVSSGAKNAITNVLLALIDSGDEVMIPVPYWVSYPEMIKLIGGVPVFIETHKENGYKLTPHLMDKMRTDKTKLLFLTSPSNPSGIIYTKEELRAIGDYCVAHNIYILSDEIYEQIYFDKPCTSIASLSESIRNITITINGMSKSFAMTGLRIGYSAAPKELSQAISTLQGHLISHPSTTAQWCALGALSDSSDALFYMRNEYKRRRDMVMIKLDAMEHLSYIKPEGAFYFFIDVSYYKKFFSQEKSFSVAFCNDLLDKGRVAAVPGIAFGMDDFIRITFACNPGDITEGIARIKDYLSSL